MAQFVRNLAEKAPALVNGERGVSQPARVAWRAGRPARARGEDCAAGGSWPGLKLGGGGCGGEGEDRFAVLFYPSAGLRLGFSLLSRGSEL